MLGFILLSVEVLSGLALLLLAILSINVSVIVGLHLSRRRRGLAAEKLLLAQTLPPSAQLPSVLIQLPVFNERHVVGRLIDNVAKIDWPRDRLEIQVLDDSNDETTALAHQAAAWWRQQGLRISVLRRPDRSGFKAGALQYGLRQSDAAFVAIFDADFLPPPDFLRQCIAPLLADSRLALVQARWDHLNAAQSLLTRAQALQLNAHFVVEQSARAWSGLDMPFNGTCGLWRRRAIDDAGGWCAQTLTEDLDLSYRVHLKGWRTTILLTVGVPGELPDNLAAWRAQQHRWNKGFAQCARKLVGPVWRSDFPWWRKVAATFHLGQSCLWPLAVVTLVNTFGSLLLDRQPPLAIIALGYGATVFGVGSVLVMTWIGQRRAQATPLGPFIASCLAVLALNAGLAIANARAVGEGLLGVASGFVRTPKRGNAAASTYRARLPTGLPELALGAIGGVAIVWRLNWASPFLCILVAGLLWIGLGFGRAHLVRLDLRHRRSPGRAAGASASAMGTWQTGRSPGRRP